MQIRLGYELIYDCPQPTPMLLMLNVHYSRVSDMVVPDHLVTRPSMPIRAFRDGFGNWCSRIVAPAGRIRLSASGIVNDTGERRVHRSDGDALGVVFPMTFATVASAAKIEAMVPWGGRACISRARSATSFRQSSSV